MIQACIVVSPPYQDNQIFNLSNIVLNRDNCLLGFYLLREEFYKAGVNLSTSDISHPDDSSIVIYSEMPQKIPDKRNRDKSYLLLFESELIRPDNWDLKKHKNFKKIFTWNDEFIDNIKYFKINFSSEFPVSVQKNFSSKKKLCILIAGNKVVNHPLELYSKRIEAIQWFEANYPMDFDLYGFGWDEYKFNGPRIIRVLNKIKSLTKYLALKFPSYRGVISEKKLILEKYKFCICYENAKDVSGYITEKIFDCFIAGCIPIYWGADNIEEHIPKNCFIDKRNFNDYDSLYEFINTMTDNAYLVYLSNIESFINSENSYQFSHKYFIKTVTTTILQK
jgi:alpha(1,3/1,4) fucosyltransferase